MHVLSCAWTSLPASSWEASWASCPALPLNGRTATDFDPLVQCSIPPNSRTVHGSSTSSEKSWLLAAVLACCSLPILPWLVSDSSDVESWFDNLLTGAIVRWGLVTTPIASTQYKRETASAPAVSV